MIPGQALTTAMGILPHTDFDHSYTLLREVSQILRTR